VVSKLPLSVQDYILIVARADSAEQQVLIVDFAGFITKLKY